MKKRRIVCVTATLIVALSVTAWAEGNIREKISTLEDLINKAETKKIDVAYQRVTLTIAKLFDQLIPGDAVRKVEDYPTDRKFYKILGREETLRRIHTLSDFEVKETKRILDKAITDIKKIIDHPYLQIKIPVSRISKISVKNGTFYNGDRPVFLSGFRAAPLTHEALDIQRDLGCNLVRSVIIYSPRLSVGRDKFNDAYFQNRIFSEYKIAKEKGFCLAPKIYLGGTPSWLADLAPEIALKRGEGWFRDFPDVDHPLTEKYIKSVVRHAVSKVKDTPYHLCYMLMGEEHCVADFRGEYTAERYINWLREKHKDIDGLNQAWHTDYKDFRQAADKKSLDTKAGHYDWHSFNQHRLVTFNQWQIDGIRSVEPEAQIICWPPAGGLVSSPVGGFSVHFGVNWEDIINQVSVVGWDGCIFPRESKEAQKHWPPSQWQKYSMGWRDQLIYYDFAKSVAPHKPIFDPEWHTITRFRHISPFGLSADFLRTALWMEHLHGLSANLTWVWGRKQNKPKFVEFLGGLLTQPQLLESWGRTTLELRRLTNYIVLFPRLERKVRILYSEPSTIHDEEKYTDELSELYEALYFLDYPVGFITENMIKKGKLEDCSLLIIPNARFVNEKAVAAIRKYQKKGGTVVITGKYSLKYNEYGAERNISDFLKKNIYLTDSAAEEYAVQLDKIMDEVGIERSVRLLDKEGKNAWGVELRSADKDGRKIVYLINLNRHEVNVTLKTKKQIRQVKDLVSNKMVQLKDTFVLKPRKLMLLELKDIYTDHK